MVEPSDEELSDAEERGRAILSEGPRAVSAHYSRDTGRVVVELGHDCVYGFPARRVEDLAGADEADLADIVVDGLGLNLHWPRLDVDLFVPALVAGVFGTKAWMTRELARAAGRSKSPAKAAAARANGSKGGRPRKLAQQ